MLGFPNSELGGEKSGIRGARERTGVVRKGENSEVSRMFTGILWLTCLFFLHIILILALCSITLIALVFRLSSGAIQIHQSARDLEGST